MILAILTDEIILSIIGATITLLVGVVGYFINRWMNQTDDRETRSIGLIEKTNETLVNLDNTMDKININLMTYQASMDETVKNVKDKIGCTDKKIEEHDNHIQDHEIRIVVLEKTNGK